MIHLICTLEPLRIPFLGQFVEHYVHLGVEQFHLSLQLEPTEDPNESTRAEREANRILAKYDLALRSILVKPFSSFALREHHDKLKRKHCREADWVVWSDIDEFQVYPGEFRSLLDLAASYKIDYFRGYLVDRVAESGKLQPFDPAVPIWGQYPRRFRLTSGRANRMSHKVTCAKSVVQLTPGNHYTISARPLTYYSEPVEVHHFKWDTSVVSRLTRRLQPDFQEQCPWWVESKEILEFIEQNEGSIAPD
jgi:hypothetical protein